MGQYKLPDTKTGGSQTITANSLEEAKEKAQAAGSWSPSAGTYGANSIISEGGGGSSGGGGGGSSTSGSSGTPSWANDILGAFREGSGFSREELKERQRQFDLALAQKEKEWEREGRPRLEIEQRKQAMVERESEFQMAMARANLGFDYLKFGASLGGPADVFQQADFFRGARARGEVPLFLQDLGRATRAPFSGAGTVAQMPQTVEGLAAQMGAAGGTSNPNSLGTSTGGYNMDATLSAIGDVFRRGPTGLAPGTLEQWDPNELQAFGSGGKKLGYDPEAWLRAYQRAGIGQRAAQVVA